MSGSLRGLLPRSCGSSSPTIRLAIALGHVGGVMLWLDVLTALRAYSGLGAVLWAWVFEIVYQGLHDRRYQAAGVRVSRLVAHGSMISALFWRARVPADNPCCSALAVHDGEFGAAVDGAALAVVGAGALSAWLGWAGSACGAGDGRHDGGLPGLVFAALAVGAHRSVSAVAWFPVRWKYWIILIRCFSASVRVVMASGVSGTPHTWAGGLRFRYASIAARQSLMLIPSYGCVMIGCVLCGCGGRLRRPPGLAVSGLAWRAR